MILFFLLIIVLLVTSLVRFSAYSFIKPVAEKSHLFCVHYLPQKSPALAELKALVCAENFTSLGHSHFYISSGLIHLFVVSGAHLVLIERLIHQIPMPEKPPRTLILLLLAAYALSCNLNPPITRSWILFALTTALLKIRSHWPAHYQLLVAGLLTLILNPEWITSLSLQLSWIAALAASLGSLQLKHVRIFTRQTIFFALLFPTIVFFQIPSSSVILMNIFLTPVLEFILFPLALIVWFLNFLHPVFDYLIQILKTIFKNTEMLYRFQLEDLPSSLVLGNWILIFAIHIFYHSLHVQQRRTE